MNDFCILKYNIVKEVNTFFVDIIFLYENSIFALTSMLDEESAIKFKKKKKKESCLKKIVETKNYILMSDISYLSATKQFIINNHLEKKVREWKIKNLLS
jgi:hypothetical protein